jgi:hypothetical protein
MINHDIKTGLEIVSTLKEPFFIPLVGIIHLNDARTRYFCNTIKFYPNLIVEI